MIKKLFLALFSIIIPIIQMSFFQPFGLFINEINIVLIILILITFFYGYKTGLYFALISGAVLDIFSAYSFGHITFSYLLLIVATYAMLQKLISHRSLYTFLTLIIIGTLLVTISQFITINGLNILHLSQNKLPLAIFWTKNILWQLGLNLSFSTILFYAYIQTRKKISSKFLTKHHAEF